MGTSSESHREATKKALCSIGRRAGPYQEAIRRKLDGKYQDVAEWMQSPKKPVGTMPEERRESERLKPMQLPPSSTLNVVPPADLPVEKAPAWQRGEEIIYSESQYVRQIGMVVGLYKRPLCGGNVISADDISALFSTLEEIYDVSKELLLSLEERAQILNNASLAPCSCVWLPTGISMRSTAPICPPLTNVCEVFAPKASCSINSWSVRRTIQRAKGKTWRAS